MSECQVVSDTCEHEKSLLIEPPAIRLMHNLRGMLAEVFHPEGIETNLEAYECNNPECNCPNDYYLDISVKISRTEYERLMREPGWKIQREEEDH